MDSYLIHYGTKHHSGRYPYGSGERPYQDEPGRFKKFKDKFKRKKDEIQEESLEKKKERIRTSRDPNLMYKYAGLFSDKELMEINNRLKLEKDLKSYTTDDISRGKKFLENSDKYTKMGLETLSTMGKMYNIAAESRNTYVKIRGKEKDPWPTIESVKKKDKK